MVVRHASLSAHFAKTPDISAKIQVSSANTECDTGNNLIFYRAGFVNFDVRLFVVGFKLFAFLE